MDSSTIRAMSKGHVCDLQLSKVHVCVSDCLFCIENMFVLRSQMLLPREPAHCQENMCVVGSLRLIAIYAWKIMHFEMLSFEL